MNIKYSFIYHMNKKRTIACWSHLLMTYSSEKIPWNFHTSLRSHLKNLCFGFHQAFQTPRNNKSTRPKWPRAFICFSVFGTPDETLALVFDILLITSLPLMYSTAILNQVNLFHSDTTANLWETTAKIQKRWSLPYTTGFFKNCSVTFNVSSK